MVIPDGAGAPAQSNFAQILGIHAALLHTGEILYFGGDEHDPGRHHLHDFDHARLFNCSTLQVSSPSPAPGIRDFFCCGHALLGDGRLLVAGGTEAWTIEVETPGDPHGHAALGHFRGNPEAFVFDPDLHQWVGVHRMSFEPGKSTGGGRWYPTLLTLGDGRVVALSGHPSDADTRHFNNTLEVFHSSPGPDGDWDTLGALPDPAPGYDTLTFYPRVHLLPDGTVFFASPMSGQSWKWKPSPFTFTAIPGPGPGNEYNGYGTTSVLLPLFHEESYRPRVLVCNDVQPKQIDLGAAAPIWENAGTRTLPATASYPAAPRRINGMAVLLPTGEVCVCGGCHNGGDDNTAVLPIELYRPAVNSWVTLPVAATVQRDYHSTALLMPDGRVWIAGSNKNCNWAYHDAGQTVYAGNPSAIPPIPPSLPTNAQDGTFDSRELRIELFEPWYFGRPDRPTFNAPPAAVSVGAHFDIHTPQAPTVSRVAIIRSGSVTHAFNPDQRYIGLPFTLTASDRLSVTVPDNENLVPPGYYLLFILNQVVDMTTGATLDVPSVGQFIRVDNAKLAKELKIEIKEFDKLIFEGIPKLKDAEGDPWQQFAVDPAFLREIAVRLDNLERQSSGVAAKSGQLHSFIKPQERPPVMGTNAARPILERTPPGEVGGILTVGQMQMPMPGKPQLTDPKGHATGTAHRHAGPSKTSTPKPGGQVPGEHMPG